MPNSFATPWTTARQAPLSMGFSRQDYWSGLPCPPPEDLPDPGTELVSPASSALASRFLTTGATWLWSNNSLSHSNAAVPMGSSLTSVLHRTPDSRFSWRHLAIQAARADLQGSGVHLSAQATPPIEVASINTATWLSSFPSKDF